MKIYKNKNNNEELQKELDEILFNAVENETINEVIACVKLGANVNAIRNGKSLLITAAGKPDIEKFLTKHGAISVIYL